MPLIRLSVSKSKNSTSLYAKEDLAAGGRRTTKIVEKLGTVEELKEKLNGKDPIEWAKEYIAELNRLKKECREPVVIAKYSPSKLIKKD